MCLSINAVQAVGTLTHCKNYSFPVCSCSASFDALDVVPKKSMAFHITDEAPTPPLHSVLPVSISVTPKTAEPAGFGAARYSALSSWSQAALLTLPFGSLT